MGLSADLLVGARRLLPRLHEEDLGVKHNLTHVGKGGREMDHGRVQFVVGAVCLLFDRSESSGDEIVQLDETGEEETAKLFHRVIRAGVAHRDHEVPMATVALDEGEEDGDLLVVVQFRVHKTGYKPTIRVVRQLPRVRRRPAVPPPPL